MKTIEKGAHILELRITKVLIGITVIAWCFLMMTLPGYAYTQTSGTVIPATAKIRAEANTTSGVIGSTAAGKTVTIVDEVTGADGNVWYQVFVDAATKGYIRSDLVTKSGAAGQTNLSQAPAQTPEAAPASAAPAATTTVTDMEWQSGKVSTKSGRIRKDASATSDLVASASRGTVVTVTGKAAGSDGKEWYRVSFTYNGSTISGFIRSDLVTFGELPEESPDPAVTEIEGKKEETADSAGNTEGTPTEEGTEAGTEEGTTAAVPESEPEPPAQDQQPDTAPIKSVTVMNAEETPVLPGGFKEVSVTLEEAEVKAWKNGDFYIFYAQSETGDTGYYMYDSIEQTYQRYYMTNVDSAKKAGLSDNVMRILLIVLAVVIVALLVVVTLLAIKLNDYKAESDWDDGEDDDYPEDEEEEEEEMIVKPLPQKNARPTGTAGVRRRPQSGEEVKRHPQSGEEVRRRPQSGEEVRRRPQSGEEVRRRPQSGEEVRRRPQSGEEVRRRPQSGEDVRRRPQTAGESKNKPRNFLAVDEEEGQRTAVNTKGTKSYEPVSSNLDPDDEDTFVFINLDGDQIE